MNYSDNALILKSLEERVAALEAAKPKPPGDLSWAEEFYKEEPLTLTPVHQELCQRAESAERATADWRDKCGAALNRAEAAENHRDQLIGLHRDQMQRAEAAERITMDLRTTIEQQKQQIAFNQAAADTLERLRKGEFAEVVWTHTGERELVAIKSVGQLTANDEQRRGMDCLVEEVRSERDALAAKVSELEHRLAEATNRRGICYVPLNELADLRRDAERWRCVDDSTVWLYASGGRDMYVLVLPECEYLEDSVDTAIAAEKEASDGL